MKNFFVVVALLLSFSYPFTAQSQGENNNWCFGMGVGLNFSGSTITYFPQNMLVSEGSASVSDEAGNLLFYASGADIWDRNGNLMPNGSGLSGNSGSSANGVAIIRSPGDPNRYFVVTTDQVENGIPNAYYTVVDMSLNSGLGDAIPAQSSVLLATGVIEGVRIAAGTSCNSYWIMLHRHNNDEYLAFKVDAAGINMTPVVSAGSATFPVIPAWGCYGNMQFNNTFTRLIRSNGARIETAAFDKATGVLTGFVAIDPAPGTQAYFTIFSPDDKLVYYTGSQKLMQMNISLLPNVAAVQSSTVMVASSSHRGMRLGPDNKIYLCSVGSSSIARIDNPDVIGAGCDFDPAAYPLPAGLYPGSELGSPVVLQPGLTLITSAARDTVICNRDAARLHVPAGYPSYHWNTGGTGPSETVSQDGIYWVERRQNCDMIVDTFRVTFNNFTVNLGPDTFLCDGHTLELDATRADATYLWQDGDSTAVRTVTQAGTYHVSVTWNKCTAGDTIIVDPMSPELDITEPDTTLCAGARLELHAVAKPASQLLWSNGSTADHITTDGPGIYTVTATSVCGILNDEVVIGQVVCNCNIPFIPNAFSPNGDGKNDVLQVMLNCPGATDFHFSVYNRYGQRVFESEHPGKGWDGLHNGHKADVGTYFYQLKYKTGEGVEVKKKGDVILLR